MRILKFEFLMQKHKKKVFLAITIICVVLIILINKYFSKIAFESYDKATIGIVATILGAIIGGASTLIGSIWVHSKQIKEQNNIKRKNTIYKPLYDELINIQNNILKGNPYPDHIDIGSGQQCILHHPQYFVWYRIKNDSRYLETPTVLKDQMELLQNAVEQYLDARCKSDENVHKIFNDLLVKKGEHINDINFESLITKHILRNDECNYYEKVMSIGNNSIKITDEIIEFNKCFRKMCNKNIAIINTRIKYKELIKIQEDTIEMLSLMIKLITNKYGG